MAENIYGIWIGENATVSIIDDYRISFLRIKKDIIASVLYHNTFGTVGVVYGYAVNSDVKVVVSIKSICTGIIFNNKKEAECNLENHSRDRICFDKNKGNLIYTMYNGEIFDLILAEKINMEDLNKVNEINDKLTVAQKMAIWEVGKCFKYGENYFNVKIDTQKYSIIFLFSRVNGLLPCWAKRLL